MSTLANFQITSHYAASNSENGTNIVYHITHLVDSYFIWVGGTAEKLDSPSSVPTSARSILADNELGGPDQAVEVDTVGSFVAQVMQGGLVAKDWACAMPSRQSPSQTLGTSLFRSGDSDESLAISQRLARRFQKQILLSLDVPIGVKSSGQTSFFLLQVEKHLLETLKSFNTP
ncbi:hypothetical protein FRC12_011562 [Ceratobasidium sp. 428]|nr:hypothetical protein FRC12_011562 [Ceratobasidium sp. 428]